MRIEVVVGVEVQRMAHTGRVPNQIEDGTELVVQIVRRVLDDNLRQQQFILGYFLLMEEELTRRRRHSFAFRSDEGYEDIEWRLEAKCPQEAENLLDIFHRSALNAPHRDHPAPPASLSAGYVKAQQEGVYSFELAIPV